MSKRRGLLVAVMSYAVIHLVIGDSLLSRGPRFVGNLRSSSSDTFDLWNTCLRRILEPVRYRGNWSILGLEVIDLV
jgi:hypothetical protein